MFLVDMTFVKPLPVVDQYVTAHRDYLSAFYNEGVLLLGGRKNPRTGGVILSRHATLKEVEDVFNADPLVLADVARFSITEFEPVMRSADLIGLL